MISTDILRCRNYFSLIAVVAVLPFLLISVSAVGVTSFYWTGTPADEKPLYLNPGASSEIYFELQNMVGDSPVSMRAAVIEGKNVAELIDGDKVYEVPAGTKDVRVPVKVTMPLDAKQGDRFRVGLSFATVSRDASGGFSFGSAFEKYFDVVVPSPKPVEASAGSDSTGDRLRFIYLLLIGIVIIVVVVIVVYKRRNGRSR